jgi:hemoglobin-like flavoprotein
VTEHHKIVQHSFETIKPHLFEVADLLYDKLFELEPNMRHVFPGDITEQKVKLSEMIVFMVENIDRHFEVESKLSELGKFHRVRGITDENFVAFRDALLFALRKVMRTEFTPQVEEAWKSAYLYFLAMMFNHSFAG